MLLRNWHLAVSLLLFVQVVNGVASSCLGRKLTVVAYTLRFSGGQQAPVRPGLSHP
jgi:hypothetical protein